MKIARVWYVQDVSGEEWVKHPPMYCFWMQAEDGFKEKTYFTQELQNCYIQIVVNGIY